MRVLRILGSAVGWVAWYLVGRERFLALEHLALAFPDQDDTWRRRTGRASFQNLARSALEVAAIEQIQPRLRERVRSGSLFPRQVATLSIPEASADPLGLGLRALAAGQFAPVTQTAQGWAVAMMTGREEAAPLSPEEAAPHALRDWREEMENQWVIDQLERLRAKTPVNVVPARLEAVRLAPAAPSAPSSRKRAAR